MDHMQWMDMDLNGTMLIALNNAPNLGLNKLCRSAIEKYVYYRHYAAKQLLTTYV